MAGALVGGLATFSGTAFNARSTRKQSLADRTHAVQDRRYEAHRDYIRGVAQFYESARGVRTALLGGQNAEEAQRLHEQAYSALREFESAAEFAGSPALNESLRELQAQLKAYSMQVDAWDEAEAEFMSESGESLDSEQRLRFDSSCVSAWERPKYPGSAISLEPTRCSQPDTGGSRFRGQFRHVLVQRGPRYPQQSSDRGHRLVRAGQ